MPRPKGGYNYTHAPLLNTTSSLTKTIRRHPVHDYLIEHWDFSKADTENRGGYRTNAGKKNPRI